MARLNTTPHPADHRPGRWHARRHLPAHDARSLTAGSLASAALTHGPARHSTLSDRVTGKHDRLEEGFARLVARHI